MGILLILTIYRKNAAHSADVHPRHQNFDAKIGKIYSLFTCYSETLTLMICNNDSVPSSTIERTPQKNGKMVGSNVAHTHTSYLYDIE